ncbi:hypothetical protein NA78x_003923 [Anatilimnocola sp. NA78]|uniref:hypothetical protein n=1 Tax=Anatilimnocola sp. NA78 TaxID=3415683 RepID=UPI003CE5723B
MSNSLPDNDNFDDCFSDDFSSVESLIASAGSYVRPTEDLRPRVLEEARTDRAERRAQERIWQLALAVVFVGLLLGNVNLPARELDANLPTTAISKPNDDPTWNTVDALSELRRRQATMLRLSAL